MKQYTIYCTEEQTKKALELGASIELARVVDTIEGKSIRIPEETGEFYLIPTAEQMINWLEANGFWYINISYYVVRDYWCYHGVTNGGHDSIGYNTSHYTSRKEATLAAIDEALDYLIENKEK